MSSRATRARVLGATGISGVRIATLIGDVALGFLDDGIWPFDSWRTNHNLRVSSDTTTPMCTRASTMMRTEVPDLRSLRSVALCGSRASVLVFCPALALAISSDSVRDSVRSGLVMSGKSLGKSWVSSGDSQGKHWGFDGEKSKQNRLDVGVSSKWEGRKC